MYLKKRLLSTKVSEFSSKQLDWFVETLRYCSVWYCKCISGHQDNFHYLKQGSSPHIDGVDDAEDFIETCKAFSLLGINDGMQEQIFRILAGILHLGNVVLEEGNGDSSAISVSFIFGTG